MATVSLLENDSCLVVWTFDLTLNFIGSTKFICPGRNLTYQLNYIYDTANSLSKVDKQDSPPNVTGCHYLMKSSTLSASFNVIKTCSINDEDYPVLVTAVLDGVTREMTQWPVGQWNSETWAYEHPQEYNSHWGTWNSRSSHLCLILEFPQTSHLYRSDLSDQFSKLFESQVMADVKIIVKGQEMAAHAVILAAASPVMTSMLEPGKFKEGQSKKVEINDIEPEVFQQLLRYVYTGTAPKLEDETITEDLFLAADLFQMDKIKEHCEEILLGKLNLENAVRYLVLAHLHSAGRLQEASIQFLVMCRNEIWDRPEWKELVACYPELFFLASRRMVKNI